VAWDKELKQLKRQVMATFGKDETDAALWRVLTAMQWPDACWSAHPPDHETHMARVRDALRAEYRRLLQSH
jgi:hypothetical protein